MSRVIGRRVSTTIAIGCLVLAAASPSAACGYPERETLADVIAAASGEQTDRRVADGVVEFATVRKWPAREGFGFGSLSIASRGWGAALEGFAPLYRGGIYVGVPPTTTSCGSKGNGFELGTRRYYSVVMRHGVPQLSDLAERELAAADEAALVATFSAVRTFPAGALPEEFPWKTPPEPPPGPGIAASTMWRAMALLSLAGAWAAVAVAIGIRTRAGSPG